MIPSRLHFRGLAKTLGMACSSEHLYSESDEKLILVTMMTPSSFSRFGQDAWDGLFLLTPLLRK